MTTTTMPDYTFQIQPPVIPQTVDDICGYDEPASTCWAIYHLYQRPIWYQELVEDEDFCRLYEVGVTQYRDHDVVSVGNKRSFHRDYLASWRDFITLVVRGGIWQTTEPR